MTQLDCQSHIREQEVPSCRLLLQELGAEPNGMRAPIIIDVQVGWVGQIG
eukprot:CAMPEP_0113275166 /NCGR_PEP_ID=MMETSP0008_2-20120614/24798_1 /TAXON_ID=97485 /ORGANISM="Prymnesium parvum" /LENGTH=49 /DNA_ID=CAMNT_0000124849 /DNA_START=337 /DNA_END=486 /DNA_ORIENTATION=- /assembly_acc=CAM_ASM_000153